MFNRSYSKSDLDAAILATVEKCAAICDEHDYLLLSDFERAKNELRPQVRIRATLPADIAQRVAAREKRLQLEHEKELSNLKAVYIAKITAALESSLKQLDILESTGKETP
jgi:hypothetical protein